MLADLFKSKDCSSWRAGRGKNEGSAAFANGVDGREAFFFGRGH